MKAKRFGKAKPIAQLTDIIKLEYFQQVRFFIDLGMEMEKTDENGRTPIMLCPFMEPEVWGTGIARLLIEKGASLENCDKYGMTVLHLACIYTRVDLAKVFLNAIDFDLLEQDKWGNTALHYAVRSGNLNLVKVITQAQWKYKFAFDKKNREGLTAVDEAYRLKMRKIAETIEAVENQTQADADNESLSQVPSLNIRLSRDCLHSRTLSDFGSISRRSYRTRPKTAFLLARRESASSSSSASSLYGHDRTVVSYRNFVRRELEPNEKDDKMILRCAPLTDFRNNPEYLFHLLVPGILPVSESMKSGRPRSAYDSKLRDSSNGRDGPYFSWRVEFKRLYRHYEYQCTPSYRDGIKITPSELSYLDAPLTPAPSEDTNEEEKGKKSKRSSSSMTKQNTAETGRQRKQSQQQQGHTQQQQQQQQKQQEQSKRRTSTVQSGKQSSSSMDGSGSMASSSESISSGTSTKKESVRMSNGNASGSDSHGRQSRAAHYN